MRNYHFRTIKDQLFNDILANKFPKKSEKTIYVYLVFFTKKSTELKKKTLRIDNFSYFFEFIKNIYFVSNPAANNNPTVSCSATSSAFFARSRSNPRIQQPVAPCASSVAEKYPAVKYNCNSG